MSERAIAASLLDRHWHGKVLPVDPSAIAIAEGAVIRMLEWTDLEKVSGWFKVIGGKPHIFFNPKQPDTTRRFTVAHELGHFALGHGDRPRDTAAEFNILNTDPLEASANRFAAELLMPEASVRHWVEVKGLTSLRQLSSIFRVSNVDMRTRLSTFGYIS